MGDAVFARWGRVTYRRRWILLAVAIGFLVFASVWGTGVLAQLTGGGFDDPRSESARAGAVMNSEFGRDDADVIVLYTSDDRTVDDPSYRTAVTTTLAALPVDVVDNVLSYYSTGSADFVSHDRRSTYAVLRLRSADANERPAQLLSIQGRLDAPGLTEQIGGSAAVDQAMSEQVDADISRAEMLSLPAVFVLLVVILGGLAAASLPLLVGGLAILGAFTAVRVITLFTDVSLFAINIITLLGLGLAIDYGLFMVNRFREELRRGRDVPGALSRTMATAGRTVAVSGVIVSVALSGLMLFPQNFLRSMGFGGMAAVVVAMVGALTVMPAMLAVLGHRVDALSVRPLTRRLVPWTGREINAGHPGVWFRVSHSVMRRPVVYALGIATFLLVLASPFFRITFGGINEQALPEGTQSRVVAETLEKDFGGAATSPAEIVVTFPAPAASPDQQAAVADYVSRIAAVPGVQAAELTGTEGNSARLAVTYPGDPLSPASQHIVEQIRAVPPPHDADVLVGGATAQLVDLLTSLGSILPWMGLLVAMATMVLLFLAFGSVVLPVKAVVMNLLSLGATFGALVWIFQDGHLSSVLGFTSTGTIEATQPVLMLAVAFGLSMDYEVFMLSRIREQYDMTGNNTEAVSTGLQRTGGIITSAALLLVIVIGAFSTSGITFIKLIGVGMIIAIVVDATIVRALLVPATMRLMGNANWWAPGPLRRFYTRFGIREGDAESTVTDPTAGDPGPKVGRHRASQHRTAGAHRYRPSHRQLPARNTEVGSTPVENKPVGNRHSRELSIGHRRLGSLTSVSDSSA